MGEIIPDYDRQRVYLSDIKKLVSWYSAVSSRLPYKEAEEAAPVATSENKPGGDLDVSAVFAKLKQLGGKSDKDDE